MSLGIAEVSQRSGVSASTLRCHDQIGLVPTGREPDGYRAYPEAEQDCSPFFGFELTLHGEVFTLTIRSPDDALPLLGELTGPTLVPA